MLYTGKGDLGTTKLFDCKQGQRVKKSEFIFEALGTLDELNSVLGYAKVLSTKKPDMLNIEGEDVTYSKIINTIQQNLFCIQAEVGGSDMSATKEHVSYLELVIACVEKDLPPITSFIVPGGGECGAFLDIGRTIARRAERHLVVIRDSGERKVSDESIVYLNRLSSVLYALARYANFQEGYKEDSPNYQ